jgi:hypothetical protein
VSDGVSSISQCFSPDGLRRSAFNSTPFGTIPTLGGGAINGKQKEAERLKTTAPLLVKSIQFNSIVASAT